MSRFPKVIGACVSDTPSILSYANEAMQRLIMDSAAPPEGWWATYAGMAFTVDATDHITAPRNVARIQDLAVCDTPIPIRNEFYEYLQGGIGLHGDGCCSNCHPLQAVDRGTLPTLAPLTGNMLLRAYPSESGDADSLLRIMVKGLDQNGNVIRSMDGTDNVEGEFITLEYPFVTTVTQFSSITDVLKDVTIGDVRLYAVDPVTGDETLLGLYAPQETSVAWRRWYLINMPTACCDGGEPTQVTGMVKLEFIPVATDTDVLPLGNIPAIIAEGEAIRYGEMDNPTAQKMAVLKHEQAIRLLIGELDHYQGRRIPAIRIDPFGTATLAKSRIGALM